MKLTRYEIKTLFKGTLAVGLLLFVWHSITGPNMPVERFGDDIEIVEAIEANTSDGAGTSGTFFLNALDNGQWGVGPGLWGWMTIHPAKDYNVTASIMGSAFHQLVVAFLLTLLLLKTRINSFLGRVLTVTTVGLVATVVGPITLWNWSWLSNSYAAYLALDVLGGFVLAGIALSWLVGRHRRREASTSPQAQTGVQSLPLKSASTT